MSLGHSPGHRGRRRSVTAPLLKGLYRVGIGCQIMDDMVDFMSDLRRKRHNYLVSLISHSLDSLEKDRFEALLAPGDRRKVAVDLATDFPGSVFKASEISHRFLESGLGLLFSQRHHFLVKPSIRFLEKRIGVAHLCGRQDNEI